MSAIRLTRSCMFPVLYTLIPLRRVPSLCGDHAGLYRQPRPPYQPPGGRSAPIDAIIFLLPPCSLSDARRATTESTFNDWEYRAFFTSRHACVCSGGITIRTITFSKVRCSALSWESPVVIPGYSVTPEQVQDVVVYIPTLFAGDNRGSPVRKPRSESSL